MAFVSKKVTPNGDVPDYMNDLDERTKTEFGVQTDRINDIDLSFKKKYEEIWAGTWYTGGVRTLPRSIYEYSHILVYTALGGNTPVIVPVTNLYTTLNAIGSRVIASGDVETYHVQLTFDREKLNEITYVTSRRVVLTTTGTVVSSGNAGFLTALIGVF